MIAEIDRENVGSIAEMVSELLPDMLKCEQGEAPVIHRFAPGLYIREVTLKAGSFAVGHHQRFEHFNVILTGRVTMFNDNGTETELIAPTCFVSKPGRKVGIIHEDTVWQNIYATTETDVSVLEATYLDKSQVWADHQAMQALSLQAQADEDRADYDKVLAEYGYTREEARAQAEGTADLIDMPYGGYKCRLDDSPIEGKGLFATANMDAGEVIAPAMIDGKRTYIGRYTNHSPNPNAEMVLLPGHNIDLVALRPIQGCCGGNNGEEIVTDYRQILSLTAEARRLSCRP